jgi:hypothetical protein
MGRILPAAIKRATTANSAKGGKQNHRTDRPTTPCVHSTPNHLLLS